MMPEQALRELVVTLSRSLFQRGFSVGSAGNISVRVENGYLMTPTNSSLGFLESGRLSKLDDDWQHVSGDKPSKEIFLHRAFYETRPGTEAVVHLHSTYATALSCLDDVDERDAIAPVTPYVVMRVGKVPILSYVPPGDPLAGDLIRGLEGISAAVLLRNHGPVVSGKSLTAAVYAAEELEETAKLLFVTGNLRLRKLDGASVAELQARFPNI